MEQTHHEEKIIPHIWPLGWISRNVKLEAHLEGLCHHLLVEGLGWGGAADVQLTCSKYGWMKLLRRECFFFFFCSLISPLSLPSRINITPSSENLWTLDRIWPSSPRPRPPYRTEFRRLKCHLTVALSAHVRAHHMDIIASFPSLSSRTQQALSRAAAAPSATLRAAHLASLTMSTCAADSTCSHNDALCCLSYCLLSHFCPWSCVCVCVFWLLGDSSCAHFAVTLHLKPPRQRLVNHSGVFCLKKPSLGKKNTPPGHLPHAIM